jgi:hypothetical protein
VPVGPIHYYVMTCLDLVKGGANLPVGGSTGQYAAQSLCGVARDKSLIVNLDKGVYWCYKCQTGGRLSKSERRESKSLWTTTVRPVTKRLVSAIDIQDTAILHTLARLGLTDELVRRNSIMVDTCSRRVGLTGLSFDSSVVTQWRATLPGQLPKYLTERSGPDVVAYTPGHTWSSSTVYVLVEDMASAFHITGATQDWGMQVIPSCLLGTSLREGEGSVLYKRPLNNTILWLDRDTAGRAGAYKISSLLSGWGYASKTISAPEPKSLSPEEIRRILLNA